MDEAGGRCIGLFRERAIFLGLASSTWVRRCTAPGERDPTGLIFDRSDGKLMDEDLDEKGNAFAARCEEARHLADYCAAMEARANVRCPFAAQLTRSAVCSCTGCWIVATTTEAAGGFGRPGRPRGNRLRS